MARLTRSNAKFGRMETIRLQGGIVGFARRPSWILRGVANAPIVLAPCKEIHKHAINATLAIS